MTSYACRRPAFEGQNQQNPLAVAPADHEAVLTDQAPVQPDIFATFDVSKAGRRQAGKTCWTRNEKMLESNFVDH